MLHFSILASASPFVSVVASFGSWETGRLPEDRLRTSNQKFVVKGHNVATKILGWEVWLEMDSAQFAALLDSISARMKQEKQTNEVCCILLCTYLSVCLA